MVVAQQILLKRLGRAAYLTVLEAMRAFTARRDAATPDELWLVEHPPVYTLGLAADPAHGPRLAGDIPLVQVERGGEITYHGPGQVVLYTLVDLARRGIKVREFVRLLECSVLDLLGGRGELRPGAPGVYVDGAKIAALGIRLRRGCAFHGLSLNVDMDLAPFAAIDPCGFPGLRVTQTRDIGLAGSPDDLGTKLAANLAGALEHA
ncbi:MAG: lipoyl(octanoyl) transferase LipB [Betaproteobacteria bacterium]|nr:lipoyl(octanoyl) transferase LipB [Betaproteobacteria bacterium]MBM3383863.1 lipoyl(octanoyl) transferase LipB [Betaproteobacteria bacterium]